MTPTDVARRIGHSVGTRDRQYIWNPEARIEQALEVGKACDGRIGIEGFLLDGPAPKTGVWSWSAMRNPDAYDLFDRWYTAFPSTPWSVCYLPCLGTGPWYDRRGFREASGDILSHLSRIPHWVVKAFDRLSIEDDSLPMLRAIQIDGGPIATEPPVVPTWHEGSRTQTSVYTEHHWFERNARKSGMMKPGETPGLQFYFVHAGGLRDQTIGGHAERVAGILRFGALATMNVAWVLERTTFKEFCELVSGLLINGEQA